MNTNSLDASSILERVTISMLLACLGHRPVKITGNEEVFFNILRNTDTKPTFIVNTQLNVWYDSSTKQNGNLIDFCHAYWPGLNDAEITEKIAKIVADCQERQKKENLWNNKRKRKAVKLPYYQIEETKPVGCNIELTAYLQTQGLWEIAIGQMKEVYYYFVDEKGKRKDFFAVGWQNENGGWEVRSKNFSGCLGNKGMTYIPGNSTMLVVFDDFYAYLNWKYTNKLPGPSVLILNYPEFASVANKRASKFEDVIFYIGN
ncbi:hypothetical protein [Pedobacter sp. ASV28]|uniref:hypothetical protein n=1 Tax=Pedobacter sp. ASV28 TaxID=2795123 RepID=UPI0018EB2BFB|nr:hypothetical protein [Pedobacter sp. ASV28]